MTAAPCSGDEVTQPCASNTVHRHLCLSQLTTTSYSWIKNLRNFISYYVFIDYSSIWCKFSSNVYKALEFLFYTSPTEHIKFDDFSVIKILQVNHNSCFLCPLLVIHFILCNTISCLEY